MKNLKNLLFDDAKKSNKDFNTQSIYASLDLEKDEIKDKDCNNDNFIDQYILPNDNLINSVIPGENISNIALKSKYVNSVIFKIFQHRNKNSIEFSFSIQPNKH